MKVKIYGFGWVGKAMKTLFPEALVHDPALGMINNEVCDVAFVSVPTPCPNEGALDTSIVEDVVKNSKEDLIVVRSTVNPGDCGKWAEKYKKNIVMQPEYLGETTNHPMTDQKNRPFIIMGGKKKDTRKLIELYQTVYNANTNIRQVSLLEAEIIKLTENRAISFKVAQCQELYDVCQLAEIDFYTIREAVYSDDPRFNLWWTFVFPDKRGFSSKCIPKDVYAWCAFAESLGYEPKITRALLEKNKEWLKQNA